MNTETLNPKLVSRARLLGRLWQLTGLTFLVLSVLEQIQLVQKSSPNLLSLSIHISLVAVVVAIGQGIGPQKHWARWVSGGFAVLVVLYCLSYLLLAAGEFPFYFTFAVLCLLALAGATLHLVRQVNW